jgi:uncharacterized protein YutE (UPF0331/DUF86 family)
MNVKLHCKSKQFLCEHWKNAEETILVLQENLSEPAPWKHQYLTSSGTYLGDIYKAIEYSLRTLVEEIDGQKLIKDDKWHKNLLEKSIEYSLIPVNNYKIIREMLSYRHFFVHGYSVKLDETIIRDSAPLAIEAFHSFVKHIQNEFDITIQNQEAGQKDIDTKYPVSRDTLY